MLKRSEQYRWLIFTLIPMGAVLCTLIVRSKTTPYFVFGYDPDYAYLFNGLNILDGRVPAHTDHPGTPVQILAALLIKALYLFSSTEKIVENVISNPERYLLVISNMFIGMNAVALWGAGYLFYRATKSLWCSLLVQATPWMSPIIFLHASRVNPEPLLILLSMVMVSLMTLWLADNGMESPGLSKKMGWLAGAGITTKLTFLPTLLLPMFLLRSFAARKRYVAYFILGALVFTSPFLLNPKQYFYVLRWVYMLFMGSGIYGQGDHTIINTGTYVADLLRIAAGQPFYLATVLLAAMACVVGRFSRDMNYQQKKRQNLLVGLTVVHSLAILMVAKHPQSDRYLMPVLGFTGFTLAVAVMHMSEIAGNGRKRARMVANGTMALVMCIGLFYEIGMVYGAVRNTADTNMKTISALKEREYNVAERYGQCAQIHQDAQSVEFAIFLGLQWSYSLDKYRKPMGHVFSRVNVFTHDPHYKTYFAMDGREVSEDFMRQHYQCAIKLSHGGMEILWPESYTGQVSAAHVSR